MSLAIFRVMLRGLLRDRGALALTFLVPAVFFLVFASVFAASSGSGFRPRVVVHVQHPAGAPDSLLSVMQESGALRWETLGSDTAVRDLVRRGRSDAGLLIRRTSPGARPTFVMVSDPARAVAAQLLRAHVERAYAVRYLMPPVLPPGQSFGATVEQETVTGASAGMNEIAYSAGAVALLFVLLSAVHGAVTLFDERDSGIIDRVVAGPGGVQPLVDGKFLFLAAVGTVQASVIFGMAWLVHGLDLLSNLAGWALTTGLASLAAAGLALALTTHFRTRQQAATFANVAMLILSALGGSMIPRFLMPEWLQAAGWLTPNAWALEAYTGLFWRDEPVSSLVLPLALLGLSALAGLLVARRGAQALERL